MPSKSGQSNKDSVEALLSDLDNLGTAEASPRPSTSSGKNATQSAATGRPSASDDAQSLLDDLDNLVQRRAPTPRKQQVNSTETQSSTLAGDTSAPSSARRAAVEPSAATVAAQALETAPAAEQQRADENAQTTSHANASPSSSAATTTASSTGGWGSWGSVWSSAAKLADQARAEIEKRAQSEQARDISQRGWGLTQGVRDFVKEAGLEKLGEDLTKVGKRGWTEVINAVAPPISAHEVIQVTLSHDMVGFDGVPDVTFKILARVMESQQVGRGTDQQLIVNKAPESTRPSTSIPAEAQPSMTVEKGAAADDVRDMRAVEGYGEGWKLAEVRRSRSDIDALPVLTLSLLYSLDSRTSRNSSQTTNRNLPKRVVSPCLSRTARSSCEFSLLLHQSQVRGRSQPHHLQSQKQTRKMSPSCCYYKTPAMA